MTSRPWHRALVVLGLALCGCTADGSGGASPSAAATPGPPGAVDSTAEVRAAMQSAGVPCEAPVVGTLPGAAEATSCVVNRAEDVLLLRFETPAQQQAYLAGTPDLVSVVVGENWAVQTVLRPTAERVARAIGGRVVGAPG